MAGRFSTLYHHMWDDVAFCELSAEARLVFQWAWGHDTPSSMTGLSLASPRAIALGALRGIDVTEADVRRILAELAHKPLCLYDPNEELLWAVNRTAYIDGKRWLTTAVRIAEGFRPSHLRNAWLDKYAPAS
jgi:hypothetical protein